MSKFKPGDRVKDTFVVPKEWVVLGKSAKRGMWVVWHPEDADSIAWVGEEYLEKIDGNT